MMSFFINPKPLNRMKFTTLSFTAILSQQCVRCLLKRASINSRQVLSMNFTAITSGSSAMLPSCRMSGHFIRLVKSTELLEVIRNLREGSRLFGVCLVRFRDVAPVPISNPDAGRRRNRDLHLAA